MEMQHDTSPHKLKIGDRSLTAQCAGLSLAYSRQLFIQYYPRFTRFECKTFLTEAIAYMQGACGRCVIDNTSVIVSHGTAQAQMLRLPRKWRPLPEFTASIFGRIGLTTPTERQGSNGLLIM
jgi:hypothetical protein